MMIIWLLVLHIAVLGYWLGSELVINSTYRFVCFKDDMPFAERSRLMEHVMDSDQHVRYALVLQASLGTMLAARYGFIPGDDRLLVAAAAVGVTWLAFVEIVHRLRNVPIGIRLARIDRVLRYLLLLTLILISVGLIGGAWPMPAWLRWKLALFAGIISCGIGIRLALIEHFRVWAEMKSAGVTAERNASIQRTYWKATSILILLWVFIAAIVYLSVAKPG